MKTNHFAWSLKSQTIFILVTIAIGFQANAIAETWEGWRGLEKQACSKSTHTVTEWSQTNNVLWKAELNGEGHSSPVASEKYIFLSSANRVKSNAQFGSILIHFLLVCIIMIVAYAIYRLFVCEKRNLCQPKFVYLGFLLLGIILFAFATMYWMYFHEKQMMADRRIAYWMFSGAFVSFMYLIAVCRITSHHKFRVILALAILPFIYFLLTQRPFPDYYFIDRLFGLNNKTFIIFVLLAVYLPVLSILFLLIKSVGNKFARQRANRTYVLKSKITYPFSFLLFIIGLSGLMIAPLITLAKIYYRKYINGAPVDVRIYEIFDFTFPYFLIALAFGFVVWYIIENKYSKILTSINRWIFPVLFGISVGFFVLLNFKTTQVLYERAISSYSRETGELLWKTKGLKGEAVTGSNYNSQATPTPVIMDNKVYSYFGSAGMMCVDFTGNLLWCNTDLPYKGLHGVGASPVKTEDDIVICNRMPSAPYITLIDSETGEFKWKNDLAKRKGDHGEYRTPTLLTFDGKEYIFEWYGVKNELRFYDAKNGSVIKNHKLKWRRGGEVVSSPIVSGDTLFLAHKLGIHAVSIKKVFNNEPPTIWSTKLRGKGPDTPSPVKVDHRIFIVSDNGYATCVDSRNGEIFWQERLNGIFYASVIADESHVYFTDTKTQVTVVKNSGEFEVVAQNELDEKSASTPAIVDDKLIIRTSKSLWCLGH